MAESVLQARNSPAQALRLLGAEQLANLRTETMGGNRDNAVITLSSGEMTPQGKIIVHFAYFFLNVNI